ncbi:autotransporter outer membrane beta-barrel domain-containing protein [Selenomonas massiliensis]|uniref:autotransporter outer membrane beta-barrel domain-containing protein n=1 Tax=Selenomonas massiliensis TaxID=2058293 RepID=UPI000D0EDE66|nr:autotransporter outer membrane beta-barrel domain-containing protein [Selenomonas massiliensis]
MLKEWKNKRQLSLLVAFALSAGGTLFSDLKYTSAADVTGGDVTYDSGHPLPADPITGGAISPSTTDPGNVHHNTLTIDGLNIISRNLYGGYTTGLGNAAGNEVILKNTTANNYYGQAQVYGGWSAQGDATGNTITLAGGGANYYLNLYGGGGTGSGKDFTTGNTLQIKGKENEAYNVQNFEKLKFVLNNAVASGDTMFRTHNSVQSFDWSKISVEGASTWLSGSSGTKRAYLYDGSGVTLTNYGTSPVNGTSGNYEYGITTDTTTPSATSVSASKIYFDRNQFQHADVKYDTDPSSPALPSTSALFDGAIYGGTSTLGNTTKANKLTVDGLNISARNLYGGYTQSIVGDSIGNEVILKNTTANQYYGQTQVYGGWSAQGDATGNTITLAGAAGGGINYYLNLYGGWGTGSGKDFTTGNTLQIKGKENEAYNVQNFEKLKFVLNDAVASGDTMFRTHNSVQSFDWSKISVTGLPEWVRKLTSEGVNNPTLTLYTGSGFTLTNYTPTLIGTVGDYEFGKRANTTATGTVGVSVLSLDGNRFQNATETPAVSGTDIHAGYSKYGNTTNHNTLNIQETSAHVPISYTNARAGYTNALNGGSDDNTLNLNTGGTVTNGYAGYTEGVHLLVDPTSETNPTAVDTTKNADAKNNTVNIKGGTLNAGGKLYGGYIAPNAALTPPNNVSAGDAKGNTINIENGTFGGSTEIYGGYTNGTGKATGNTVNLGSDAGVFTAPTFSNVTLYGGGGASASDVITDNTLNINAQGITAAGIHNFGKIKVNLKDAMTPYTPTNPLLTVTNASGLDWAGVEVNPEDYSGFTASTYEEKIFNAIHKTGGISFMKGSTNTYNPIGATGRLKGNYEYVIDTDNHTVNTTSDVVVKGFQYKNHNATFTAADGSKTNAWSGRTQLGTKVQDNKLTVTGGTITGAAYGALVENKQHNADGTFQTTAGKAERNALEISNGNIVNAYGAKVTPKGGSADENSVKITGGTISGSAYGAELSDAASTGTGTKNKAEMTGGTLTGSLYGAHTAGSGTLTESKVKVSGGTIGGSVYGSDIALGAGDATGSKITISGGSVTGSVYGGKTAGTGAATGHTLNLYGGTVSGSVYGGHTASGATTGNTVNLGDGVHSLPSGTTVTGTIYGGNQAADTNNVLNVNTNATAGNIANFGMVKFNFNSTFNQANPMLNLVGGSATSFDWNKFTHTGDAPSGTSVLMQNLSNINIPNYNGAKEISSTGTNEYTIDTDTGTGTAKQILFGGYQFKGAVVTPTTSDAAKDVWAGRSVIGNTTTSNTLTLNGTNHRDAYGGWTAGTGTTAAAKFDSTGNIVNLQAGNVRTIYGGFTSVQSGNATGNKVNISGGEVGNSVHYGAGYGNVYGGYLSHAAAAGNATGNTVTVTGGRMKDIYGGFTVGTGATTGNTVNLGTESDAVASSTSISGTIYGGSKADATNNTLNVYDTVSAGNIANFDTVHFKVVNPSRVAVGGSFLTLNDGNATNLDWNKLSVEGLDSVTASATSDHIFTLLHNANNINLSNYSTTGTRGRIQSADYEADITTDGNNATSQNVYLKGYRFQNNTGANYAGGPATDAWGGRSIIGKTVTNNKLTLTGGSATLTARGGMVENTERDSGGNYKTNGDATKNKLILNTGAQTGNAYGAEVKTKAGSATKNIVEMNDGTVHGNLYGAALTDAAATGNADANEMTINGGTVSGTVYGSHNAGAGNAKGNTVTIKGGSLHGIYGGFTNGSGATTDNTVNLGDGEHSLAAGTTINGTIYGGNQADVTGNTLNVNTNAQAGNIQNFGKLQFNLNSNALTQSAPMLGLSAVGGTNNLDWRTLDVNAEKFNAPIKTYEAYNLVLMENTHGISFQQGATNTYTAGGGVKSTTSGDFEFTIDTLNHTASSTQVTAAGYKYKNHSATYNEAAPHAEAWAGRSAVGNKVENNKLSVTGGTINTAAYGGLVINNKPGVTTGDAENNKIVVNGTANVADAYGAQVRTKDGNATENSAEITGGSVTNVYGAALTAAGATGKIEKSKVNIAGGNISGSVYGGQIRDTAATGSISGSTLTLTGGSVTGSVYGGDNAGSGAAKDNVLNLYGGNVTGGVYGGHTASGVATGNTVNLGDGTTNAVTAVTGVIHGGNQADVTGNTLNVKTNATAGNIHNFETVKFHLNSTINPANSLLTLNNGAQTTGLNWAKLEVDTSSLTGAGIKTYEPYKLNLIENTAGIATTGYAGAKDNSTDKFEYVINTDNNTATADHYVTLEGYQFKDNDAASYTTADGTNAAAWAGRTKVGHTVENNTLKVTGGTINTAAYGGVVENNKLDAHGNPLQTGDATNNKLLLEGGSIQNGYGADVRTQAGNATGNVIDLKGATVSGSLYGGALTNTAASGNATGNTVNILSGSVGDVYGGFANGTGKTTGNTVNLGTETTAFTATSVGTIYGGNKAEATDNTLNVNSRNAGAADVKNFENVNFDAAHNVSHGDTMLTLTNGAGTSIDWSKMKLKNLDTITASPTSDHILTLLDSANDINFTNYDAARARETKKDGDYEYVLNTEHETDSDKKVDVTGYRFANNHPTYSAGTAPEAWGGRSKVGNTVTKNALDVTGGTITKAAGGIAQNLEAGDGVGGYKKTGDAAENTLTLNSGAIITDGYGADVRTEAGNATGNIIDLKGANVTGNLYGGALTHASASGAATQNNINLYSGSVTGDVYGGFASGNGTTTGNKITIGDGTNDAAVTVTGKLIGGNKSAEGNVLNLKSKGAQVGSLENFGKITWSLGSNLTDGDTVLTLNQDTTLTYSTIEKPAGADVSNWLGSVMEKNVHLFQMAAGKKLTLSGYTSTGSERTGDAEYSLVTDNNQQETTGGSLNLSAYKWQNASVDVNSNARSDVFGGKTVYGTDGATKNNKLTLKTGAAVNNAIAGATQTANGAAEENILTVEDGSAVNAYGAKTVGGKALKNKAILTGGSVTDKLVGAQSQSGTAEENTTEIKGGSVTNAIGAETVTAGDAANNHAIISSGTVTGSLKGAQSAGKATKNTAEIKGGTISGASVMGAEAKNNAEENTVTISAAPTSNASTTITGGHSTHGNAVKNVVNVNAVVTGNIVGGSTDSTNGLDAIENTVNVNANVTGNVYGGHAHNASLRNTVNIADGITVDGSVFGGSCITAVGNIVNIGKGSTVTGDVAAGNATGSNRDNIINLTGSRVNSTIKGGNGGANDSNNTLAVHHDLTQQSYAGDFTGIKNLQFYLNEGITNENPTILNLGTTSKDIRGIDVGVGVNGLARGLKVNDVISLMKVAGNGTLTTDADSIAPPAPQTLVNHVETMQGVSLLYGFDIMKRNSDELIATVTRAAISEETKSFTETRAGATSFINGGADLLAGAGMTSAKKEGSGDKDKDARGYHIWAAMEQSGMTVKSGSYSDTQGYGLAVGWTRELGQTGSTLLFSPFVEYGKGKYDSYLDSGVHGSGKVSYLGLGVMGRVENAQGLWAEAALHGGKTRSDYSGSLYSGTSSSYDSSNAYYAAHLGIGKEMKTNEKDRVNAYLRYFWSYQSGMQAKIHTSGRNSNVDEYNFGAVNSNRVRLGFSYTHKDSDKSEIFAGLAWEYELSGKATASFMGYETPSPSLRGGSGMLEVGYRFAPKDSRFSYDLRFAGWQGKRQGYSGGAHVNWAF